MLQELQATNLKLAVSQQEVLKNIDISDLDVIVTSKGQEVELCDAVGENEKNDIITFVKGVISQRIEAIENNFSKILGETKKEPATVEAEHAEPQSVETKAIVEPKPVELKFTEKPLPTKIEIPKPAKPSQVDKPNYNNLDLEDIQQLLKDGWTVSQIAAKYEDTKRRVYDFLRKHKISARQH